MKRATAQFKISENLLALVNDHQQGVNNRNTWLIDAAEEFLVATNPRKLLLDAADVLGPKTTLLVRLDKDLKQRIDQHCEKTDQTRTIFMLNACIHKIAGLQAGSEE